MMRAVFDLSTVAPHEPARRSIRPADYELYCEGYYRALQMALVVMGDAEIRWRLYLRDRRRRSVQAAAAAAASAPVSEREPLPSNAIALDRLPDSIEEGAHFDGRHGELERSIANGVLEPEFVHVGPRWTSYAPTDIGPTEEFTHSGSYRIDSREKQLPDARATIVQGDGLPWTVNPSDQCPPTFEGTAVDPSSSPGQSETTKRSSRDHRG